MFLMVILRLADALKDSFNMTIERLDIQYNAKISMYYGYLTLKEDGRVIEFEIYTNGTVKRLSGEEVDVDVLL